MQGRRGLCQLGSLGVKRSRDSRVAKGGYRLTQYMSCWAILVQKRRSIGILKTCKKSCA
uniref:Uncharacterized protein n=1 Tax=Ralstonia solanacearum TaxID=305 RepID=A0A0S4UXL7_RALSL|nr:protein of unknown function [Ralstonia solanacearum]